MKVDLARILEDPPDEDEFWRALLKEADEHAPTHAMHARDLAGQIYAARVMKRSSAALVSTLETTTAVLAAALSSHEQALKTAADASTKQAQGLRLATWALVAATLVLAAVAALPLVGH
jgi:hypothetical protein